MRIGGTGRPGAVKSAVALAAIVLWGAWGSTRIAPAVSLAQDAPRPAGWSDATHSSAVTPDYARLFAMDRVHELRITIPPDRYQAMQADLLEVLPAGRGRGAGPGFGGPGGGPGGMAAMMEAATAACTEKAPATACSVNGAAGQCNAMFGGAPLMCIPPEFANLGRQGGAPRLTTRDPMYVPVTITYDGRAWTQVGMRYKGNSSLMAAGANAGGKIPFRLNFDRYEDETPAIRNQRFYGFQELTFSSNFGDDSQMRELLATEILRDRGVPAARAAFYRIVVDTGTGPEYWGLYTMIEDPSDGAMLDAQLGSSSGNLYKPDGPGADWTRFTPEGFAKKNNEDRADFSDVSAAVAALHAPRTDAQAWRSALETRLDVDGFLRWLAVNTVMENWDSYGVMPHNYYLYGDPARRGQLRWIPWDHNFAFGSAPGGGFGRGGPGPGGGPGGGPGRAGGFPPPPPGGFGRGVPPAGGPPQGGPFGFGPGGTDVLHEQVGENWPLIRNLMADPVYAARYREHLTQAMGGLFVPEALTARAPVAGPDRPVRDRRPR